MGADSYWIRKRERPPRRTGPSTVDGKTANEMIEERTEAIRRMSPDELAAYVTAVADQARASRAERTEAAAWRRAQRYRMN